MKPHDPKGPRLDWRDPEMPVLWPLVDNWTGRAVLMEIPPWEAQQLMQQIFHEDDGPHWSRDPTYNLAKRRRRR